ncbi:2',3'-cyclic-nucleotide 2'-phosphodiesterase / 3'-nucleotidase [Paracoccus isoporae]|uniref:2',3'-cyclic-nucleotide 2'-phosphodiesterase / 3'-nucleotidase n=1 Tax=Paracoccus isoporae TaxID=591205 RepID=A0A1G7BSM9_9RHOB|nr:5'-nucleotidase C-terminal domain-containing protein [Paracoccus isoporae]SDE29376.1 2',3'-cyclic-nucleotide 2'-phosphodiesterase / 3'-nucleotidase [Paracoccus isoporae]
MQIRSATHRNYGRVEQVSTLEIAILATTDLHMQLGDDLPGGGLARIAPLIAAARERHANLLLFDNGDLLQGTPQADEIARAGLGPHDVHPAIAALNRLRYDAACLGNHDFTYGIAHLRRVLRDARYQLTLANAGLTDGAPLWSDTVMLRRRMRDAQGADHMLRIGVFGVLPPQTTEWEPGLARHLQTEDVVRAAGRAVSSLRARGADLVVALSHGGPGEDAAPRAENAAACIAALSGVDAVIAGHTHEVLVRPAAPGRAALVMAGFGGSHLAAVTLRLRGGGGAWQITDSIAEARPATVPGCARLRATVSWLPQGTRRRLDAAICRIGTRLSSHFALLGVDHGMRLVESAMRAHAAETLPHCNLPMIFAQAPFRTGGRGGPGHYVDIPSGKLSRGDLSRIYPFGNHAAAIELTGSEIAQWLERAAALFTHLPDAPSQTGPLIDPDMPGFQFDVMSGVEYGVDLSRAPAFDRCGRPTGHPGRIVGLCHAGRPVARDQRFLVFTNSYRLNSGGVYETLTRGRACLLPEPAQARVRDIIARHLMRAAPPRGPLRPFFRLHAPPGTKVWFDTAPEADLSNCPLPVMTTERRDSGFLRLGLQF